MTSSPRRSLKRLSGLLVGALLCVSAQQAPGRDGGDLRAHRLMMFRGQGEGRGMRQAERAQQRSAARAAQQQREAPVAPREAPPPPQAPAFQPAEPPQPDRSGRPGRLTPDERRALRQQINEAGRDVYRPSRP